MGTCPCSTCANLRAGAKCVTAIPKRRGSPRPANCCNAQWTGTPSTYEPSRVGRCVRVPACALCLRGCAAHAARAPGAPAAGFVRRVGRGVKRTDGVRATRYHRKLCRTAIRCAHRCGTRMKLALWRASAALTIIKYQSLNELTVERPGAKRMWMCVFGSGEVGRSGPVPFRKFRADIPDRWSGLKSPAARRNPLARIDQCSRQRRA